MIRITNNSTSELLVSLADAKAALQVTSTDDDATMEKFIRRASVRIETYCGQPLLMRRYEVRIPSYGGARLQLPHRFIRRDQRLHSGRSTRLDGHRAPQWLGTGPTKLAYRVSIGVASTSRAREVAEGPRS